METFLTMAVFTAACLSFKSSRNLGLICLALLYIAYPNATLGTLVLAGIAYFFWRKHK